MAKIPNSPAASVAARASRTGQARNAADQAGKGRGSADLTARQG